MSLPPGVQRNEIDGKESLVTRGPESDSDQSDDQWRRWDPTRSKLAAMLDHGLSVEIEPTSTVLYLGAATGTTVSHLVDITQPVYAVEFAPRPMRKLINRAESRSGLIPLLKDARHPERYAHVVESGIDLLVQDVATRDQARVACRNAQFLNADGQLALAVKARSEDVTADPADVFSSVRDTLASTYEITQSERLDPVHLDHLAILARPRD